MPVTAMPAIDQAVCVGWTQDNLDAYTSMPFYLAKMSVDRRKLWGTWSKYTSKRKWAPNKGDTLKGVRTAPSPHLRQFAEPSQLRGIPTRDVINVREVTSQAQIHRHRFESPALNFFPAFNDFMDHVDDTSNDIMEKIERYEDLFIRTCVWHMSPFVFICQANDVVKLVSTSEGVPIWSGTGSVPVMTGGASASAKNSTFIQSISDQVTGHLTLTAISKIATIMETDLRVTPFSGNGMPQGNDNPLNGLFALNTSSEAYNQFIYDKWLLNNKNCDFDVVNQNFRGKIMGRVTCGLEDLIMRCTLDGTFHAPELRVGSDDAHSLNDTEPNPNYTDLTVSPIEIGAFIGGGGYESIQIGPPPSAFTGDNPPHNFPGMWWNGEVKLTKLFLKDCVDPQTGNVRQIFDPYGEDLMFVAQAAFGMLAKQRRNIIPVLYLRHRGPQDA